jgi:hypothetical protein
VGATTLPCCGLFLSPQLTSQAPFSASLQNEAARKLTPSPEHYIRRSLTKLRGMTR